MAFWDSWTKKIGGIKIGGVSIGETLKYFPEEWERTTKKFWRGDWTPPKTPARQIFRFIGRVGEKAEEEYIKGAKERGVFKAIQEKEGLTEEQTIKVVKQRYRLKGVAGAFLGDIDLEMQYPALTKVRTMVGRKPTFFKGLWSKVKNIWPKAKFELTDRFAPLQKFDDLIKQITGKKPPVSKSPYKKARLFAGRFGKIENSLDELRTTFKPVRGLKQELTDYLLSNRALERAKRGFDNPAGVTAKDSQKALNELKESLGVKKFKAVEEAAEGFYKWADKRILEPLLDSGIISQRAYNNVVKLNKKWTPFDVLDYLPENPDLVPAGREYFSVNRQGVIKGMTGTEKLIRDPIESVIGRLNEVINLIERNKVARTLVDLRSQYDEFKDIIMPLLKGQKPPKGWDSISVFIDGKVQKFAVDSDIGEAMKQLTPQQSAWFSRMARAQVRAFKSGATAFYLPFTLTNVHRDVQMAVTTSKYGFGVVDWTIGFTHGVLSRFGFKTKLFKEYLESNAGFSGFVRSSRGVKISAKALFEPDITRASKIIFNPLELSARLAESIEFAPRLGIFRKGLKIEKEIAEAALESRQATIDFARGGRAVKIWNQWIPFINARLQARLTLVRSFKERPFKTALKATTYILIPAASTYFWNRTQYDEVYKDIPQYVKDNYFTIIWGDKKDEDGNYTQIAKIPKGDVGTFFWNPIEHLLDYTWKQDYKNMVEVATAWLSEFSPIPFEEEGKISGSKFLAGALPPFIRVPAEITTNKIFWTGFPIVSKKLENVAAEEQYTNKTSEIAKRLGRKFKISPLKIEATISGLFGGAGWAALEPKRILEASKKRFVGARAANEEKAWDIIEKSEKGYYSARIKAERLLEEGKKEEAKKILDNWNKGIDKYIEQLKNTTDFSEKDLKGYRKSIYFDTADIKRLKEAVKEKETALEKMLKVGKGQPSGIKLPSELRESTAGIPLPSEMSNRMQSVPLPSQILRR